MTPRHRSDLVLEFHPLTSDRWTDFEMLFGERGACGGCWCMLWRLKRSEFDRQKGEGNKEAMKALVDSGEVPGILAYVRGLAIGWCAIARRACYPALARSRVLKSIDGAPVWSVTCLFVEKGQRNKGVSVQLLRAAVAYVKEQGARWWKAIPWSQRQTRYLRPLRGPAFLPPS